MRGVCAIVSLLALGSFACSSAHVDSGADAQVPAFDAGPAVAADAGAVQDAGRLVDAGSPVDAGAVPDAGSPVDAGAAEDAGSPADAGQAMDAGSAPDAGQEMDAGTAPDAGVTHPAQQKTFGGDRPVTIQVPDAYDNNVPTPLIMLLHGRGVTGAIQTAYFHFDALVNEAGIILAAPDGTVDSTGTRFWNATDACCDFDHTNVDDDGYITGLIRDIAAEWNVDPKRVYLVGHSNGGFMSYRLACNHADLIAAIASLAGDTWADPSKCQPSQPVSVLQIQGTLDSVVYYNGGSYYGVAYPGSVATVGMWAGYNQCSGMLGSAGPNIDLDTIIPGADTTVQTYAGCPTGIDVGLWTDQGGSHIPSLTSDFHSLVWAWLAAHPKQ